MSDSLQPHGLQHARLPCPSLSPWDCLNSCHWINNVIQLSHSVTSISSGPQSFRASGSIPMKQLFSKSGQSIGASILAPVLPMNIQVWFLLELTGSISLLSKDSQNSSQAPEFESVNSSVLSHFHDSTLTSMYDYWKNHSFDYTYLCWQSFLIHCLGLTQVSFLGTSIF